ncbi:glycosyltransferase family 2 protein [Methylobacterium sp. A54F]
MRRLRARPWLGRAAPYRLAGSGDADFPLRLDVEGAAGRWLVLSYSSDPLAPPLRPLLRILIAEGGPQDFVLPGMAADTACWLGLLPRDATEIRIAPPEGFAVHRVALRSHASVLGEALLRRPRRLPAALLALVRGDARRYRDSLRGACAAVARRGFRAWAATRAAPVPRLTTRQLLHVFIPVRTGEEGAVTHTLAALRRQEGASCQVLIAAEAGAGPCAPDLARVEWDEARPLRDLLGPGPTCLLLPGDTPRPDALATLGAALVRDPGAALAYGDGLTPTGQPVLRPDWSPDLALATLYPGRPCLLSADLIARIGDAPAGPIVDAAGTLALRAALASGHAVHLPRILGEEIHAPWPPERHRAVAERLFADAGVPASPRVEAGAVHLQWPLPEPAPRVSIVIPTRDRLDLIARACAGVLQGTDYPTIELVIVDNGSTEPAVLAHYETLRADPRVRFVAHPQPFNFSAMVNAGVAAATGSVVVLLNNDVAVLRPDWLGALVRQACRPGVGAVGAKLLYGDGTLQHAGVVVGLGGRAGHILRGRAADTPGHLGQLRVAHEVSGVTAACLAVERNKYEAVGGFDAEAFPIDFNDVDFCLRLDAAGYKTVWTPAALLAHLESVSRGPSVGPARARFEAEAARFTARWRERIRHDPFYHPALSLTTFGEDLE